MFRATTVLLAAVAPLFLSSCVWNIGEIIRSSSAVHVGADLGHSVAVYSCTPEECGKDWGAYVYAPEVTYRTEPRLIECIAMGKEYRPAYDIRPTGRTLLVKWAHPYPVAAEALPQGAKRSKHNDSGKEDADGGQLPALGSAEYRTIDHALGYFPGEQRSRGSIGAQILAAPFDFVIDPALSVVTSTIAMVPPFMYLALIPEMSRHQQARQAAEAAEASGEKEEE